MHVNKAAGYRIYRFPFLDEVKPERIPGVFEKFRLIIKRFSSKTSVITHTPTMQCALQLLRLVDSLGYRKFIIFFRDMIQAYAQAKAALRQTILARAPAILGYPLEAVYLVILHLAI